MRSIKLPSWAERLAGIDPRPVPPHVFGMDEAPSPGELELIGLGYRPWRSATAWYCWRAVEVLPPG